MPDTQNANNNARKNRSFGAFLLFLTVIVAILLAYGSEHYHRVARLTQDQYEYLLYSAKIDKQTMKGQNLIEGTLKPGAPTFGEGTETIAKKDQPFEVSFVGLEQNERRYQQVKAIREYELIQEERLREAIQKGWYTPQIVRQITTYQERGSSAAEASGAKENAARNVEARETDVGAGLFVAVLAVSRDTWIAEWEQQNGMKFPAGQEASMPPLKDVSSTIWLEVQKPSDVGQLVGLLKRAGAGVESLTFDLGQGTNWSDGTSFLMMFALGWGPWLLILVLFFIFMRQMRSQGGAGGVMSFGRSRATLYTKENHTNVTFDDVAGAQEAKDEVREVVEFLKNPSRFTRIGGRIPRGILLVGPPGCGKTLLAKAIAGEAEVPFFSISGSDFVEMFVGVGASRVRDLFKTARENSPCIIFLDEIDAVGRRRGSGLGGGHDEREQTLNAILVEMDGFGTDEGIIVIAATNRPDVLDPALLRPGRFDREVVIDLPDVEGREEILRVHLKKVKAAPDADARTIAKLTPGYSGADLAAIINEAAIRAALAKKEQIGMDDLEEAREKVRFGRAKKSRKLEVEDKKITAYHEAGHAIVAASIPEIDKPHKVTIVPRGRALGVTLVIPDKESYHMQKKRMLGQLALCFGGRVAEEQFCGDISAGAFDDIRRATELARAMVTELGMSEKIGPISYADRQGSDFLGTELMRGRDHSEQTAREIDEEVRKLLTDAHQRAREIVRDHKDQAESLAQALLTYETLNAEEIEKLMNGLPPQDLRPGSQPPPSPPSEPRKTPTQSPSTPAANDGRPGELPGLSPA